jgi:histone arginine demethylase JMJD6
LVSKHLNISNQYANVPPFLPSTDSPVLDNIESDCQFFAWDFEEFSNVQQVFDMPRSRYAMEDPDYTPWYVGWANCDKEAGEVLREHYQRPSFLPDEAEMGGRDWFFIGTPGFGAPFHIDEVRHPSWQAQVKYYLRK